jgi:hypothetical protein
MRILFRPILLKLIIFLALLLCTSIAIAGAAQVNQTTTADARKEVSEAVQVITSYSAEQRDAAVLKAKDALAKSDARIETLQQQMDQHWQQMSQEAREMARKTMSDLQKQRTEIAEWYGGLMHSSSNAWEEIKKGFSKSYTDLENSLEKAREKF